MSARPGGEPDPITGEDAGAVDCRSVVPALVASLAVPIDESIVLPSLWNFVQELGGDAEDYGLIQVAYYTCRLLSTPAVGWLVGRAPYFPVMLALLALGVLASLVYAAAPLLGGVRALVVARSLLGIASACSVASLAYVAEYVPADRRTGAYAVCFGLQRACAPLAPALNLLAVRLPALPLGRTTLTQNSYAGLIMAAANVLLLLNLLLLREPRRSAARLHEPAPAPREVCRTLVRTGAYVSYFTSFQNNWSNQVVNWTLPILTSKLYPQMGAVGNSVLLACGGIVALFTVWLVPWLSRGVQDRWMICLTQLGLGAVLLVYARIFGCRGSASPPLWALFLLYASYHVPFLAQMPANNAIYTKLIGPRGRGIYIALLEMSKTSARIIAGFIIGEAYESLGSCALWQITLVVWAAQWLPLLANWRRLHVEEARAPAPVGPGARPPARMLGNSPAAAGEHEEEAEALAGARA